MDADQVEAVLKEHIRLCSDLHDLLLEEGRIMRTTSSAPDEAFLLKKREFLPVLDKGLQLLQKINQEPDSFPQHLNNLVTEARDQIMKLMMLDRENERLLLKASLPPKMKEVYSNVVPGQVAKTYAKYASS